MLMTIAASLVGWFSFNQVGAAQSEVNDRSLPEVLAAFGIAQESGTLVNAAPLLTSAATPQELATISATIDEAHISLEEQLAELLGLDGLHHSHALTLDTSRDFDIDVEIRKMEVAMASAMHADEFEESVRIHTQVAIITASIEEIKSGMSEIFELNEDKEAIRTELTVLRGQINDIMIPAVDNQLFYTMTGYRNLIDAPAARSEHFSETELAHYRSLAGLQEDTIAASQIMESAFAVSSAPLVEPLRERFESEVSSMERNMALLDDWPYRAQILPMINRLTELGTGSDNVFDIIERELEIREQQQNLLALNSGVALALVEEVNALVDAARSNADAAAFASTQAMLTGRTLLLAISALSIVGALLIAWLFVGRTLLRRLGALSDRMTHMADGDLETEVEVRGRDEVSDMGRALEVFRRNSLEAQRLNLVEQLAEEVQGKNAELESVLSELERAQDQIVMREKLAALGELTAGVAHEIRNPLNFVKNFSEASEDLLSELDEVLADVADDLSEEDKDYIQEISGDLTSNLERIRNHGERANRIVDDMLQMGRDTGEQRMTDINALIDEHARLAYHSARAMDNQFQLHMLQELDPNMGEINVVPRDLGRVFLNMIGNACDATDEKRRELEAEPQIGDPYMPTLRVSTQKGEENVTIRIRDNGKGMPPDVIEKIFNPFFTTKPTDKGTGLGLAISNDIVRQHGGSISVDSEDGEYTEMTILIPLEPPTMDFGKNEDEEVNVPYL